MCVQIKSALMLVLILSVHLAFAQETRPTVNPGQLVREVVFNELHDHQQHGFWRYWIKRHSSSGTNVEEQVETAGGPVAWVALGNGRPLSPGARMREQASLARLLLSPDEQARHLHQYSQDEERIGRIVALLPDAFLYTLDGEENGSYQLHFHPNPDFPPHSTEERIFHAMSGTLWVDARSKRLAGLEGHIDENIDFGFGLLGRLYKGGWFRLRRVQVSATEWKTAELEMHMNIRALLVTSFSRETSEVRGGFTPVPKGMTLAQGIVMLETPGPEPLPSDTQAPTPVALSR